MTRQTEHGTRAHFHGTLRCGSWYACPICSSSLRIDRAADVIKCVQWWRDQGGEVELLTLTFAHGMGDDLRALSKAQKRAWRLLKAGQPGKRLMARLGVAHYIRGTDTTHGRNGWHPHFHVILFTKNPGDRRRALRDLRIRWHRCVLKTLGPRHAPSWTRGVDLRECQRDEYIAKLGLEVVSSHTKTSDDGETPWEIARRAAAGRAGSVDLWRTYCAAMKGERQLIWSRDLRASAALGEEKTDQEIVDAVDNDAPEVHVASIPLSLWEGVARVRGAQFAIVRGAEDRGRMGVALALGRYIHGLAPPEPGEDPDQLHLELFGQIAPRASAPKPPT